MKYPLPISQQKGEEYGKRKHRGNGAARAAAGMSPGGSDPSPAEGVM